MGREDGECWREFGYDTRSLGIGSRESQEARFQILVGSSEAHDIH